MLRLRDRRTLTWVALGALLCVSGALLVASFVHTDDGCYVEVHCIACRLVAGSTVVIGLTVTLPIAVAVAAVLVPAPEPGLREAAPRQSQSRAPPLA